MLQAFEQFLMDKEGVPKKNTPYYVKWVSDCYRFVDKPETHPLTNEQTAEFITRGQRSENILGFRSPLDK